MIDEKVTIHNIQYCRTLTYNFKYLPLQHSINQVYQIHHYDELPYQFEICQDLSTSLTAMRHNQILVSKQNRNHNDINNLDFSSH